MSTAIFGASEKRKQTVDRTAVTMELFVSQSFQPDKPLPGSRSRGSPVD